MQSSLSLLVSCTLSLKISVRCNFDVRIDQLSANSLHQSSSLRLSNFSPNSVTNETSEMFLVTSVSRSAPDRTADIRAIGNTLCRHLKTVPSNKVVLTNGALIIYSHQRTVNLQCSSLFSTADGRGCSAHMVDVQAPLKMSAVFQQIYSDDARGKRRRTVEDGGAMDGSPSVSSHQCGPGFSNCSDDRDSADGRTTRLLLTGGPPPCVGHVRRKSFQSNDFESGGLAQSGRCVTKSTSDKRQQTRPTAARPVAAIACGSRDPKGRRADCEVG